MMTMHQSLHTIHYPTLDLTIAGAIEHSIIVGLGAGGGGVRLPRACADDTALAILETIPSA